MCGAHSNGNSGVGLYHQHVPPSCLLNQLGATDNTASPMLGYMVDGFPVYGPRGPNGVYMKRCSEPTADKTYCLDQCGGFYDASQTIWADGFVYRYFILGPYNSQTETCDIDKYHARWVGNFKTCGYDNYLKTFYPFTPLCLRGCIPADAPQSSASAYLKSCASLTTTTPGYVSVNALPAARQALATYTKPVDSGCIANACASEGLTGVPKNVTCAKNYASIPSSNKKCFYGTSCLSSDKYDTCQLGSSCVSHPYWSQCVENTKKWEASSSCVKTLNWGCSTSKDCCNANAICGSDRMCQLPKPCNY
jgi:hypothetical protein